MFSFDRLRPCLRKLPVVRRTFTAHLHACAIDRGGGNREAVEKSYRKAPSLPIDIAVMERSQRVLCLPVEFAWSDVGT